jgi:hypothetical protein
MIMSRVFNGEWWSVRLPPGWCVNTEEHGASFFRTPTAGTLQISAARKSSGEVSDNDLRESAQERLTTGYELKDIRHEAFSGFECVRSDGTLKWYEWWLKYGALMVYATYVVPTNRENEAERGEVIRILESLAVR